MDQSLASRSLMKQLAGQAIADIPTILTVNGEELRGAATLGEAGIAESEPAA